MFQTIMCWVLVLQEQLPDVSADQEAEGQRCRGIGNFERSLRSVTEEDPNMENQEQPFRQRAFQGRRRGYGGSRSGSVTE